MQESDDEFDEDEFPDENDDGLTETVPCPSCGADVYDEAEQCPYCGNHITSPTNPWGGRSAWWVALAVLGLVATVLALSGVLL